MTALCGFSWKPGNVREPTGLQPIGIPRKPIGRCTGTHGIPWVIKIVPARSHGIPWHTVDYRKDFIKGSHGVPREFTWCVAWDAVGLHDTSYRTISTSYDVGSLGCKWEFPREPAGFLFLQDTAVSHRKKNIPRDTVGCCGTFHGTREVHNGHPWGTG